MEDIVSSIRRILSEDETPAGLAAKPPEPKPPHEAADDGVLVLDPSMMVPDPAHEAEPLPAPPPAPAPAPEAPPDVRLTAPPQLVAHEVAAAAATSVGSLVRTLTERTVQVRSGGPTVEDIVREELRPLLKSWLDANLPALVERLVRAEIDRVVGRVVP
jgi:cell pole-organizing protein PopZ